MSLCRKSEKKDTIVSLYLAVLNFSELRQIVLNAWKSILRFNERTTCDNHLVINVTVSVFVDTMSQTQFRVWIISNSFNFHWLLNVSEFLNSYFISLLALFTLSTVKWVHLSALWKILWDCVVISLTWVFSAEDELKYMLCCIGRCIPIMSPVYFWCCCGDCLGSSGRLHSGSHQI